MKKKLKHLVVYVYYSEGHECSIYTGTYDQSVSIHLLCIHPCIYPCIYPIHVSIYVSVDVVVNNIGMLLSTTSVMLLTTTSYPCTIHVSIHVSTMYLSMYLNSKTCMVPMLLTTTWRHSYVVDKNVCTGSCSYIEI